MSSTDVFFSPAIADGAQGEQDLGALARAIEELRQSLDGAAKAVGRFVREADPLPGTGLATRDAALLPQARECLHQAGGALDTVGMAAPALVVRAMEAAVRRLEQTPQWCTAAAASSLEGASLALLEYLKAVLAGENVSSVALFPQYRTVQALAGNDKAHPADLWPTVRRMREPAWKEGSSVLAYGPQARALLDAGVLGMVKSGDAAAAAQMRAVCLGLAAGQQAPGARTFWKIAAGFFDAWVQGLVPHDVYAKRVASRVLLQYASMAKGDNTLPERLTQDLLFFCAQAQPAAQGADAPVLRAVRQTFGLERHLPVDYEQPRFGHLDPVTLEQARHRIGAVAENWSALAIYDAAQGELRPIMGHHRVSESEASEDPQQIKTRAPQPLPVAVPREEPGETQAEALPPPARPQGAEPVDETRTTAQAAQQPVAHAPLGLVDEDTDEALLGIFLEEAREVVDQGLQALDVLADHAGQLSEQATLRRVFHSLKGNARMVGLDEFGEAGWAMEQMLNAWLAEQKPLPAAWQALAREALEAFAAWVQAIADGTAMPWSATPFRAAADAMRLEGERAPVALRPCARRRARPALRDAQASPVPQAQDDSVKVIDGLRIPLPLYNVYLNEADEWSRRLDMTLQEWALELHRPQPEDAVAWAHSLAGSSATIGFKDLSRLARSLEQALMHVRPQGRGDAQQLGVFQAVANEIRRLLHQFAAGFLKSPQPAVEAALQQVLAAEIDSGLGEMAHRLGSAIEQIGAEAPPAAQSVRVRAQLLDRLIGQSGEVLSARSRIDARLVQARSALYDLNGSLERLRQQLRDIEVQVETQMQSRLALSKDVAAGLDPLEFDRFTQVQELTRMMAESVNDVATVQRNLQRDLAAAEDDLVALGRQARDLQRGLQRTRMVAFDAIS